MPTCTNCERYVSHDFVRVFGSDGEVAYCVHCSRTVDLHEGKAAR